MKNRVIQALLVGSMFIAMSCQVGFYDGMLTTKEASSTEVNSSDEETDTNGLNAGVSTRSILDSYIESKLKETKANVTVGMLPETKIETVSVVIVNKDVVTQSNSETTVVTKDDSLEEKPEIVVPQYSDMDVPSNNGFKAYETHTLDSGRLRFSNAPQVELQSIAYTDTKTGIRMVDGRYCVALGSYYSTNIGQKFDLIMENGAKIPCILADGKDDRDTDSTNRACKVNGGITEFVVDRNQLNAKIKGAGSVSGMGGAFDGEIAYIRMYE